MTTATAINSLNVVSAPAAVAAAPVKKTTKASKGTKPAAKTPVKAAPVKKTTKASAKAAPAAANATPAPANVVELPKRQPGRPISEAQIKVRRRVESYIQAQTDNFTVKEMTKKLKLSRMHVSNAMRWAEGENLVTRIGYKVEKRAGRKELIFRPAHLPKLGKKEIKEMIKAGTVEALAA